MLAHRLEHKGVLNFKLSQLNDAFLLDVLDDVFGLLRNELPHLIHVLFFNVLRKHRLVMAVVSTNMCRAWQAMSSNLGRSRTEQM